MESGRKELSRRRNRDRDALRGSALLLVLAVLVLLSALVLAFMGSVTFELTSSQTYANGATVRQLADSASQLAISQVVSATGSTNSTLAWASQPGMIRTFDTAGRPAQFYKLYSSASMVVDGAGFDPSKEAPPADWDSAGNAGLYTDLNSPVANGTRLSFPILDPRALSASATSSVEGFSYSNTVNQAVLPSAGADQQRLPMPVRWLYVLQNGQIATPSSGGSAVSFAGSGSKVPSASNPIVGRIAFWTDDETCKVDINTASEGTFWDRPWANTTTEQNFATAIPAQNEFQRYPGHPAKTSLSAVFGPLGFPTPWPNSAWYYGISSGALAKNTSQLAAYYSLVPRIADGGTKGGSVNQQIGTGTTSAANPAFQLITPDGDRLYSSPDEMLYDPKRLVSSPGGSSAMSASVLEKAKFFITAHSRAPEVNLFGKPRMTLWPLQANTAQRNAKDALIAFCSTINGLPYYFQRASSYSAPATLGGGSPTSSSQSPTLDWSGVARNQALYGYLNRLSQQNIPGFGGNFAAKYPGTSKQILTEMFDMIRSGVNGYSSGLTPSYNYAPTYLDPGEGQIVPLVPPAGTAAAGTHGFGRFVTVTGATLVFYRSNAATPVYASGSGATGTLSTSAALVTPLNPSGLVLSTGAQIGAVLLLNPFTPSPGFPPWSPNVTYKVSGLDQFRITSPSLGTSQVTLGFPSPLTNTVTARAEFSGQANATPFFNVVPSLRYATTSGTDANKTAGVNDPIKQYPFIVPISPASGAQLAATDKTFDFNADSTTGHAITITIYSASDVGQTTPIQTITMNFPPVKGLLVPTTTPGSTFYQYLNRFLEGAGSTLTKAYHQRIAYSAATVIPGKDSAGNAVTYYTADIVRSVDASVASGIGANPAQGDYRVFAALSNVPASYFSPTPGYDTATPAGSAPGGSGYQPYTNANALRDNGTDGSGGGGFGFDASIPGGYYPHFPLDAGGSSNVAGRVLAPSVATGILIPQNQLALYGGAAGRGSNTGDPEYRGAARPSVPPGLGLPGAAAAKTSGGFAGDWDNMTGLMADGPYINKPDEGNSNTTSNTTNILNLSVYYGGTVDIGGGYFSPGIGTEYRADSSTTLSPNRQISSAVMFGSLPTGIDPSGGTAPKPWQTLLFCADPAGGANHPGFGVPVSGPPYSTPPDHLYLDLFTMPVVEPYAISEPLSMAGKINMNYQILPFTYIRRDTGVRAVMKATRIMAIPQSISTVTAAGGNSYKDGSRCQYEMRYNINPDETVGTLAGFEARFAAGDVFRSASEICGIHLVPQKIPTLSTGMVYPAVGTPPGSYAGVPAWWSNFLLTGDNTREFPYGDLYARLTTKSNTYTVHVRVQTLKKVSSTSSAQWVEGTDLVTGEYRGSSLVERYVDTSDTTLPDFASPDTPSVEGYYKIRTVSTKKFEP